MVFGKIDFDAVAGGLDVADVHDARQCRGPEAGDRSATGVERQMVSGALVEPARRHHPCVLAGEIALLRSRNASFDSTDDSDRRDCPADRS